jgi:hypothetical protein
MEDKENTNWLFGVSDARSVTAVYRTSSETTAQTLVSMVITSIRYFATMGLTHTTWQVPACVPDVPLYDRELMTETITNTLRQAGYSVYVLAEQYLLYISWAK